MGEKEKPDQIVGLRKGNTFNYEKLVEGVTSQNIVSHRLWQCHHLSFYYEDEELRHLFEV